MTSTGRGHCQIAMQHIERGQYQWAIDHCRLALRQTHNRRAWSKLMLAIRELSRIAPLTAD